jgi:prophage DNA circulation protein
MGSILDIRNPWRNNLIPASFRGVQFHCEANSLESGRRMVQHQFPKRDLPYAEDMGRRAVSWSVRGYCICYPMDLRDSLLYRIDYRIARDALMRVLADGQAGVLTVQTLPPFTVWCERYKLTEEEKFGGYCTFDMTFIEAGTQSFPLEDTATSASLAALAVRSRALVQLAMTSRGPIIGENVVQPAALRHG